MSDQALEQAVLNALHLEPRINATRIFVRARERRVTLCGEVDSHTQKLAARYKAECVLGVENVVDELEVSANEAEPVAGDLAKEVLNALYWDAAVPSNRVTAKCEKGWVTLTGEVDRPYQKSSAEADVRRTRGVVGVTNAITVASSAKAETAPREATIPPAASIAAIAEERQQAARLRANAG